jgi:hypothetical protein
MQAQFLTSQIRVGLASWLPFLLLLTTTSAVQAQDYSYKTNSGALTITGYTGSGGVVTIPGMINGLPVTAIGERAFYSCTNLTRVTIPDSVTKMGEGVFEACSALTHVTISKSVASIGDRVFADCYSLCDVEIPRGVTNIGHEAFFSCASLTSITIPVKVRRIGDRAFFWCKKLWGIIFECDVLIGGAGMFDGDDNLSLHYTAGSIGWGPMFGGRPITRWEPEM